MRRDLCQKDVGQRFFTGFVALSKPLPREFIYRQSGAAQRVVKQLVTSLRIGSSDWPVQTINKIPCERNKRLLDFVRIDEANRRPTDKYHACSVSRAEEVS